MATELFRLIYQGRRLRWMNESLGYRDFNDCSTAGSDSFVFFAQTPPACYLTSCGLWRYRGRPVFRRFSAHKLNNVQIARIPSFRTNQSANVAVFSDLWLYWLVRRLNSEFSGFDVIHAKFFSRVQCGKRLKWTWGRGAVLSLAPTQRRDALDIELAALEALPNLPQSG